jgi:hypothetical protein
MSRAEYQELWDHVMSMGKKQLYQFRIDMIDGVKVYVFASTELDHKKHPYLKFEINFTYHMGLLCGKACDTFDEFLILMTTELPKFKFDKHIAQFRKPEKRFDTLIRMHDVKLDGEICCVCHDLTISKTCCKHHMCLQCWSQLSTQSCPVCRKCLCCNENIDECEHE